MEDDPLPGDELSCHICRLQASDGRACWAWHRYARCELNPIALLQYLRRPGLNGADVERYVRAVTGITVDVSELPPETPV